MSSENCRGRLMESSENLKVKSGKSSENRRFGGEVRNPEKFRKGWKK